MTGSDGDEGPSVSRRKVLAAATATGALGVLGTGAGGTGALFSDHTTFEDNSMVVGAVDLQHCWQTADGSDCNPSDTGPLSLDVGQLQEGDRGSGSIRLQLPADGGNNSAWLWARARCPEEACGLDHKLEVSLFYDVDCGGRREDEPPIVTAEGEALNEVTLCEAKEHLADGVRLEPNPGSDDPEPLPPGTDYCLGIEWEVVEELCGSEDSTFELDFVATQFRHAPEPTVPWDPQECEVDCDAACREDCYPASFVAFCIEDTGTIAPNEFSELSWTSDTVSWKATKEVDAVVLYYGPPTFEAFRHELGGFDAGERHTITRGEGQVISGVSPPDPCPDTEDSGGCGVKYEFEERRWECVCKDGGPSRDCEGGADE